MSGWEPGRHTTSIGHRKTLCEIYEQPPDVLFAHQDRGLAAGAGLRLVAGFPELQQAMLAATVAEVTNPRLSRPALEWTLSRIVVEPVTEPVARRATAILAEAGLHGHRHAIDAMLSATALAAAGPVTVLTSDPEDIATLCGRNVTVIKVLRDGPGRMLIGPDGGILTSLSKTGLARRERDELAQRQTT